MKTNDRALESYLYENRVSPTPEFSDRIDAVCDQIRQSQQRGETKRSNGRTMPSKRRALVILIAAVLLLLSACAAYAIYWSSTQRAKDYSKSEQAVDDRQSLAEQSADMAIAGMTFYGVINETAEVDGIVFEWKGASYWPNDDPPEMHIAFSAVDAKTGDNSRLYDFDYVLTAGGKDYPAYTKADGTVRELPAIAQADGMAPDGSKYEIWFRIADQEIADGTPLTLSGTLYAYDANGQRGNSLGSFTLDFIYKIPTEQIEAERARLVEKILANIETESERQDAVLAALPDEMTPLNITQDEWTFTDARVTPEGFVLGTTVVTRTADSPSFYMDGYQWGGESVSSIFTPDMERPRQDWAWETAYYGTSEGVSLYPWYAPVDELPETVLIAMLRDAGSDQRRKAGPNGYEDEVITYTWNAVELLLRINPRTGEVTMPKDDAERQAWREETLRLAVDGRNDDLVVTLSGEQTINGVTIHLKQLHVQIGQQKAWVTCEVDGVYYPGQLPYCPMTLYLDGVSFGKEQREPSALGFSEKNAQTWVDSNGGWKKYNGRSTNQGFEIKEHPSRWPDTYELQVVFEVSDRKQDWSIISIGTFDITTTVMPEDIVRGTFHEIYDLLI